MRLYRGSFRLRISEKNLFFGILILTVFFVVAGCEETLTELSSETDNVSVIRVESLSNSADPDALGGWDYCSEDRLCAVGEGDCDNSNQCQSGLSCQQNIGAKYGWNPAVDVCESPLRGEPPLPNVHTLPDTEIERLYVIKLLLDVASTDNGNIDLQAYLRDFEKDCQSSFSTIALVASADGVGKSLSGAGIAVTVSQPVGETEIGVTGDITCSEIFELERYVSDHEQYNVRGKMLRVSPVDFLFSGFIPPHLVDFAKALEFLFFQDGVFISDTMFQFLIGVSTEYQRRQFK